MKKQKKIYIKYTVLFIILCMAVYYPFLQQGKTLVWIGAEDGLSQHFTALTYWGEYLREFFSQLIKGKFSLPMWDMKLGVGGDILSTLNYYAIGDPLTLLAAFIPRNYMDIFYSLLYFLRMYLAGITFLVFCRYMKKDETGSLLGAICYVFCTWTFLGATRHPFFLNPMIYLPLLLLGVEKIFKKERPYLFVIMVGISAVSNFYFFYMLTIFVFFYALIRYPSYETQFTIRRLFLRVLEFLKYFLLGLGSFAIMFLPIILGFFQNARGRGSQSVDLLYSKTFYKRLVITMFGEGKTPSWTLLGYVALLGIAAVILLLQKEKHYIKYKIAILGAGIGMCIPVTGLVLNGFSYVANRWIFLLGFILAFALAEIYPKMLQQKLYIKVILGIFVVGYMGLEVKFFVGHGKSMIAVLYYLIPGSFMLVSYLWSLFANTTFASKRKWMIQVSILGIVCLNAAFQGKYNLSANRYMNEFLSRGEALGKLSSESIRMLQQVEDTSLYRVENTETVSRNYGVLSGLNTTSGYYSVTSGVITEAIVNQEQTGAVSGFGYNGLGNQSGLMSEAAVKYLVLSKGKSAPEGFEKIKESKKYVLYKNNNALSFGYAYNTYITTNEYKKLNGAEKENAMLQTAVVDEKISGYQHNSKNLKLSTVSIKNLCLKELKKVEGVSVQGKYITVNQTANIRINLGESKGKQRYIRLKGTQISPVKKGKIPELSRHISVKGNTSNVQNVGFFNEQHRYYFGRNSVLIPIKDSTKLEIKLQNNTKYSFDDIQVIESQETPNNTSNRVTNLQDIKYNKNVYQANINSKTKQIVCIPIPYSKGWTAYVDGKKTEVLKVNDMYQGILVDKGIHKIKLTYCTPGLKIGALISLLSILILVVTTRRKREKSEKE